MSRNETVKKKCKSSQNRG